MAKFYKQPRRKKKMQVLVITRPAQFLCDAARNLEVLCTLQPPPKCRQQPDELWPSACAWRGGQSAIADRDLEDVVSTSRRLGGLAPGQSRAARSLRDHVF